MARILEADRSQNLGDCMSLGTVVDDCIQPGAIIVEDCMAPIAKPETLRVRSTSKSRLIVDLSTVQA